jgi:threonine synthase
MRATVYVPDTTPAERVAAIEDYGATVIAAGDRAGAATAAQAAVGSGRGWYASHVYQPSFVHGVKTLAFELWEQLGRGGPAPATVVVPAGNGTLVMGLWLGFRELGAAPVPRLVAVQAERCAPLAGRLPAPAATGPTAATGIAIARPPRAGPVLAAVRASRGWVVTVSEEEIAAAGAELARSLGVRVEPSAAAAWAGRPGSRPEAGAGSRPTSGAGSVVVVLTGAAR